MWSGNETVVGGGYMDGDFVRVSQKASTDFKVIVFHPRTYMSLLENAEMKTV